MDKNAPTPPAAGRSIFVGYDRPDESPAGGYGSLAGLPVPQLRRVPGQTFAVALSPPSQRAGAIFGLVFSVVWNAISVTVMVKMLLEGSIAGAVFMGLFVAVGCWIAWNSTKPFTRRWRKVPTLEVPHEPLISGEECRVALRQPGPVELESYRIDLVCLERARYRFGTDTRTEERVIHEQAIFTDERRRVTASAPWCEEFSVTLPTDLPGSFAANSNEIEWHFRVRATIPRFPDLDETFPFIVLPALEVAP